jgi:hypothetical protein
MLVGVEARAAIPAAPVPDQPPKSSPTPASAPASTTATTPAAGAATAPTPAPGAPLPPATWVPPPAGFAAPGAQGNAPPSSYGNPPPSAYPGAPPGPDPRSLALYADEKKTPVVALLLELWIPGLGSVYAGHAAGALVTWGLTIGGVAMLVWGLEQNADTYNPTLGTSQHRSGGDGMIVAGALMMVGGRVYGLVDSWSSTNDYNDNLASGLGVAFTIAPVRAGRQLAWGPALSLRF